MRRRKQKGHIVLELGLSAGVLITTLAGAFQFGYIFYSYNQLVTAIGNGARYAAQRTYRSASTQDIEKGRTAIRNVVVFGSPHPAADARPAAAGLTPEGVTVNYVLDSAGRPTAVDVGIAQFTIEAVFGSMKLEGRPAVEFPFVGRYAPGESEK